MEGGKDNPSALKCKSGKKYQLQTARHGPWFISAACLLVWGWERKSVALSILMASEFIWGNRKNDYMGTKGLRL